MKYIEPLPKPRCGEEVHLTFGETLGCFALIALFAIALVI